MGQISQDLYQKLVQTYRHRVLSSETPGLAPTLHHAKRSSIWPCCIGWRLALQEALRLNYCKNRLLDIITVI